MPTPLAAATQAGRSAHGSSALPAASEEAHPAVLPLREERQANAASVLGGR